MMEDGEGVLYFTVREDCSSTGQPGARGVEMEWSNDQGSTENRVKQWQSLVKKLGRFPGEEESDSMCAAKHGPAGSERV